MENKIKELEEKLARYETNRAAPFYLALMDAFDEITKRIRDKTLDPNDEFFCAILMLSEKSKKIFEGFKEGISLIKDEEILVDKLKDKRIGKAQAKAI